MSKKKSFSGSTMTLKDFHGGSIPSDLPLPSAPGVIVRPADRPSYDRQNAWGNPMGKSDHRLRPSSSGSIRNLDDKTPFLTNTAHVIGRNFEEDERKPLDGSSGPRRTVSDVSIQGPLLPFEPKSNVGRFAGQHGLGSVVNQVGVGGSSYLVRVVEGGHLSVGSRPLSVGGGSGSFPNAWGVRKEAVATETVSSSWSGQSSVSKFAQASALDQISSGRWETKPLHHQVDVEVIGVSESPNSLNGREKDSCSSVKFVGERKHYETLLVRHTERGLALDEGIRSSPKGMLGVERVHSPAISDEKQRGSLLFTSEGLPLHPDGKCGSSETQGPSGVSERPKLKLLPRTKPFDVAEPTSIDTKQDSQPLSDTSHLANGGNSCINASQAKPGPISIEPSAVKLAVTSNESGNKLVERPMLDWKPRSQLLDQSGGKTERERFALFGGAQPREMVLKERGVDDVINSHEEVQNPSRIKSDIPRSEVAPAHANIAAHGERIKNLPTDPRTGKGNDKRDQRADVQKSDMQRTNWRNENWRIGRNPEKHQRQPSPETWRKPVDQPSPSNPNNSGPRFGKAASAVELAQAFSRPVSSPKSIDQFPGQRGIAGSTQVPFSRLTGPPTRAQINGY